MEFELKQLQENVDVWIKLTKQDIAELKQRMENLELEVEDLRIIVENIKTTKLILK